MGRSVAYVENSSLIPRPPAAAKPMRQRRKGEGNESEDTDMMSDNPIMRFFEYEHLPPHLQAVSKEICEVARSIEC